MAYLEYKENKRDGLKYSYADVDNNINNTSIDSKIYLYLPSIVNYIS
jgi:hypothetical protein